MTKEQVIVMDDCPFCVGEISCEQQTTPLYSMGSRLPIANILKRTTLTAECIYIDDNGSLRQILNGIRDTRRAIIHCMRCARKSIVLSLRDSMNMAGEHETTVISELLEENVYVMDDQREAGQGTLAISLNDLCDELKDPVI